MSDGNKQDQKNRLFELFHGERVIIPGLVAVLALAAIAAIFWTPSDYFRLLRPVPDRAALVASFYHPDLRVQNLATNAFFRETVGRNGPALAGFLKGNRLLDRVVASRTILAYMPEFDRSDGQALVVCSWFGAREKIFRWALCLKPPKDILPLGEYNGRKAWVYGKPLFIFNEKFFLSFAFDEGVFMGCLAREESGIVRLLKACDGQTPSIARREKTFATDSGVNFRKQDFLWLRCGSGRAGEQKNIFASWSVDSAQTNRFAVSVRIWPRFLAGENKWGRRLGEFAKLLPAQPDVVAGAASGLMAEGFRAWLPQIWARKINAIIAPGASGNASGRSAADSNLFAFAVMSGEYGGKYGPDPFRMSLPTLLFAVSGLQEENSGSAMLELVNFINWRYRLKLAFNPVAARIGKYSVHSLGSERAGDFAVLQPDDWPAFVFCDGFLLLASNASALKKLLAEYQSGKNNAGNGRDGWFKWVEKKKTETFVWIAPDSGWRDIRLALTGATLPLSRGRPTLDGQVVLSLIKALRNHLENMDAAGPCGVWFEPDRDRTVVHFELGLVEHE